jgi:hypothetical protein
VTFSLQFPQPLAVLFNFSELDLAVQAFIFKSSQEVRNDAAL